MNAAAESSGGGWGVALPGSPNQRDDSKETPRVEPSRPEVVTLCGSMRFLPQMLTVAAEETARGAIVLAPFAVVPPSEQDSDFKARLDELHRRKIDLADRVVVVSDSSGYWGDSTSGEIGYARSHDVPVAFRLVHPNTHTAVGGGR